MTDTPQIVIERDPLDGCVARVQDGTPLGTIMNETQLHEAVTSGEFPEFQAALEQLRAAKEAMGFELDIVVPTF